MRIVEACKICLLPVLAALHVAAYPLHAAQLFRTPVAPMPQPQDLAMDCAQLEREIAALLPLTYSYKPIFYENPYQGGALLLGTTISPWFYVYPVYDYYLDYREASRIIPAQDRLETLRHLKADLHCFQN